LLNLFGKSLLFGVSFVCMRRVCVCSKLYANVFVIVFIEAFSAKAHDEHKRKKKEKEQRQT